MKRIDSGFISVGFLILFSLTILLAFGVKNSNNLFPSVQSIPSGLRADGDPAPPFPPPKRPYIISTSESVVVADGDPAPPFPNPPKLSPNAADTVVFIADGDPAPPFPKPPQPPGVTHWNESMVVADGDPAPPFPRPPLSLSSESRQLRQVADGNRELTSV